MMSDLQIRADIGTSSYACARRRGQNSLTRRLERIGKLVLHDVLGATMASAE